MAVRIAEYRRPIGSNRRKLAFSGTYEGALVYLIDNYRRYTLGKRIRRTHRTPRARGARGRGYCDSPPPIVPPQNPSPRAPEGQGDQADQRAGRALTGETLRTSYHAFPAISVTTA